MVKGGLKIGKQKQQETDTNRGSNYLGAMKISVEIIDMCENYGDMLQMLKHINDILQGDKIEAIFAPYPPFEEDS